MKISEMDEREFNRFQNLIGQTEKFYQNKEKSFRTEANYKTNMNEFCKYLATETKINNIDNIKAKHIIGFVDQMKSGGLSNSTQKIYLSAIRDFADRAKIDQRNIPTNNRLGIGKRTIGNVDRTWSEKESQDFKEVAKIYDVKNENSGKMELVLDIARNFGCRLEGILNLDLNAINKALDTGELSTKEKNGKINIKPVERLEQREILEKAKFFGDKNGNRKIFVEKNSDFKKTYKEIQNFIGNNREGIQEGDRIKSSDARALYGQTKEIYKANITIHGLRHTYLQEQRKLYISQGISEKKADLMVSKLAGHNRGEVTKIYLASSSK